MILLNPVQNIISRLARHVFIQIRKRDIAPCRINMQRGQSSSSLKG